MVSKNTRVLRDPLVVSSPAGVTRTVSSIALDFADLPRLPSASIRALRSLPRVSAIYFVWDSYGILQYVGRASDLLQRWTGSGVRTGPGRTSGNGWAHKVLVDVLQAPDALDWTLTWQEVPPEDLHHLEGLYIKRHAPLLNKTGHKSTAIAHKLSVSVAERERVLSMSLCDLL